MSGQEGTLMSQILFVRVECDAHVKVFGESRTVEREPGEDSPPPWMHTFTWDQVRKRVYVCDDCIPHIFGSALEFVEAHGEEIRPGRRPMSTSSRHDDDNDSPKPTLTVVTPQPKGQEPEKLKVVKSTPASKSVAAKPVQASLDISADLAPYPCPLCPVRKNSATMLKRHALLEHHLDVTGFFGSQCHACGRLHETPNGLAAHFGGTHVKDGTDGRTLAESFVLARDRGDPHGSVAAVMRRHRDGGDHDANS